MINNQDSIALWDKIAKWYEDIFMHFDLYNNSYNHLCRLLPQPEAEILEIGCGPGNISRYLLNTRPDFKITATDAAPNMVQLATINNPEATCLVLDARNLEEIKTTFDAVVCGFCLPYLSVTECENLFSSVANILKPKGLFYCSTINGNYEKSGFELNSSGTDGMQVYYYSMPELEPLLLKNNFDMVFRELLPYQKSNGQKEEHLIFIAKFIQGN